MHQVMVRKVLCIAAGVVMYLAFATRTVGIVLPVVFVITTFLHERKVSTTLGYVLIPFLVLFLLLRIVLPSEGSYFEQLGFNHIVIFHNIERYFIGFAGNWAYQQDDIAGNVFHCIMGVFIGIGYLRSVFTKMNTVDVFVPVYLLTIVMWPTYQFPRFLIPVFPFAITYAVCGLVWIVDKLHNARTTHYVAIIVLTISVIFMYLAEYKTLNMRDIPNGVHTPASQEFFSYIRENTDEDAVFVFRKPRVLSLYAQRSASVYSEIDDDSQWAYFSEIGADYLVTSPSDYATWRPFLNRSQDRLTAVFSNSDFVIYRIVK